MAFTTVTANDGSLVEFDADAAPIQGGCKDVYFSRDKRYVVAFYRNSLDPRAVDRLEHIVGPYRERIFDPNASGNYWNDIFCWPDRLVRWQGRVGIAAPTYAPQFFFSNGKFAGKEKNGKWFASAKLFNRFVPDDEKGTLFTMLRACLTLSRGMRRLHAAGLAHSDLSYNNCLINPKDGQACVIDLDGLVVPGKYPPEVVGTPDFIAPEVVKTQKLKLDDPNKALPCRATDQHALSVLIYSLLFHRHPLRGSAVYSRDEKEQERLEMGERALFVEHPTDASNRLKPDSPAESPWNDTTKTPYTLFGQKLAKLFRQAFIDGLHDPTKRPTANAWETAIVQTSDSLLPCSNPDCVHKWFVLDQFTRQSALQCPCCGTRYGQTIPILDFYLKQGSSVYRPENHCLTVFHNLCVYLWHIDPKVTPNERLQASERDPVGYISFYRGRWVFVNQKISGMRNLTTGANVPPGGMVELQHGLELQLYSNGSQERKVFVRLLQAS
ncbi:MAG: hypothetical protein IKK39_13225 [Thermoguttaceae bacterium]|nr:hypothetical protein [Thermoguttaceae bacterium]MBR4105006.1 hypothetical protein [Thermoguttaceae bacterium]